MPAHVEESDENWQELTRHALPHEAADDARKAELKRVKSERKANAINTVDQMAFKQLAKHVLK